MNEPNFSLDLDTALQLEEIKLIELARAKATQRQNDLTALERNLAAKGGALSSGRLIAETDIIFGQFESTVEALILYRKQLAIKVPALLQPAHLSEFQAKLDHHMDLALMCCKDGAPKTHHSNRCLRLQSPPCLKGQG